MKFILKPKWIIGLILVFCLIIGVCILHNYAMSYQKFGKNVENINWLPATSTNISYYKSYFFTAYEFTISEENFLKLAEKEKWNVKKITEPVEVPRYTQGLHQNDDESPDDVAVITSGYYYNERWGNGGNITVGFDDKKLRAYYQTSPR